VQKKDKFSLLFDNHYSRLYNYAFKMLKEKDMAEEIVQETFIKLWKNFEDIKNSKRSVSSFLIVTLKNTLIDHYRKDKVREKHTKLYSLHTTIQEEIDNEWEISECITQVYAKLPSNTLEIFQLSRDKGLSYKEIAVEREISIKTVESHISKALSVFRIELKEYL